jgi:hypothetical protein
MHVRLSIRTATVVAATLAASAGCGTSNPARPSVSFATPSTQSPADGAAFNFSQQPLTLTIANAPKTGAGSTTYLVEVSTAASFDPIVVSRADIPEGSEGVTTVTLPVLDAGRTYYWRSRAVVDGVEGALSNVANFVVRANVVFQAPVPVLPANGPVFTERPTFVVQNASRTGTAGAVTYEFQVSTSSTFASLLTSATVPEQPSQTSWTPPVDLPEGTIYWRARAIDASNSAASEYSSPRSIDRQPSSGDQIDLRTVTIVQGPGNIASWPATARVTATTAQNGLVCIDHTHLNSWPGTVFFDDPSTQVQGNQWMFAFINGRWYGGSGRWYRPGQACKDTETNDGFGGTFYMDGNEPLRSYVPRNGDLIGLMSSTPNRFYPSMKTVDERSNVVVVRWGG